MTDIAVLIPTVRPVLLDTLLATWHHGDTEGLQVHILAQREEQQAFLRVVKKYREMIGPDRLHFTYRPDGGPLWPRRAGYLRDHGDEADAWLLIDDDFELLEGMTHWRGAVQRALEPSVGVVSCNWARSEAFVPKKWPVPADKVWVKEPVINIGGGLAMRQEVARLIGQYHVDTPWIFDGTMYGLVPYLEGFTNWRFRGSLVIHRIMGTDGLKVVRRTIPLTKLPEEYITLQPAKPVYTGDAAVNNWNIPTSSSLTPLARQTHERRRKERFGA